MPSCMLVTNNNKNNINGMKVPLRLLSLVCMLMIARRPSSSCIALFCCTENNNLTATVSSWHH